MTPGQLQKLLANGEGLHCEFKKAYDALPANLFETVCAFLNTDGGDILLGVADDGRIVGVAPEKITRFKADIANLSNNAQKIEPAYLLFPEALEIDGKTVIMVHVPVSSQLHRVSGAIYMRSEDGDYRVHGTHQLAGIINRKLGLFSEQRAMPHFSMDDLRVDLFERARRLTTAHHSQHPWTELSPEQLLKVAGFMAAHPDDHAPCLSLAAILMFGSDEAIQKAAPAYAFDCLLRRENVDRYDDRLQIRTNLIEAYDQMMGFVEKHLNDPFYLEENQRISLRDKIFREAISNIIAHREYLHGTPGRLIIYTDKVILSNPCMPHYMGIITPENLEPFARNPVICQFLIQLGRFERIGSGVTNINRYLPLYTKNAKPVFEEKEQGFRLTIPLVTEGLSSTEAQTTPEVTPEVIPEVTPEVAKIVHAIKGAMSRTEIMGVLRLKDNEHFRKHYLQSAISAGMIEMTIPDKPRSKNQRYRLTEKGQVFGEKVNYEC